MAAAKCQEAKGNKSQREDTIHNSPGIPKATKATKATFRRTGKQKTEGLDYPSSRLGKH